MDIISSSTISVERTAVGKDDMDTRKSLPLLLVEDYEGNIMVAMALAEIYGYSCDVARSGKEALDKFSSGKYFLILMDIKMPDMDGYEVSRRMRALEQENSLPRHIIIALTANALVGDREKCTQAGMDDYLAKPFTPSAFEALLMKYCSERTETLASTDK